VTEPINPKYQGRAATWAIALLAGAMIYAAFSNSWADFWIYQDGRQLPATISAERMHGVFEYDYSVNEVLYVGSGVEGGNLSRDAHVGQKVLVWVSTSHPRLSSPEIRFFSLWGALATLTVLFAIEFFALRTLVRMHRRTP
jgi:hypothetical protein